MIAGSLKIYILYLVFQQSNEAKEHSDAAFSDDDLPTGVDLNDPFFKDALREDGVEGKSGSHRALVSLKPIRRDKQLQLSHQLLLVFLCKSSYKLLHRCNYYFPIEF